MSGSFWERSWSWVGDSFALVVGWRIGLGFSWEFYPTTGVRELRIILGIAYLELRLWRTP